MGKPKTDYDFHLLKLNQQGNKVWEKYFGGNRHDYLSSAIALADGGFLIGGTSFSNTSQDKKEDNLGGSDIWLIRLNESGDEVWQKTIGTKYRDEISAIVETVDDGFIISGNINANTELLGGKDAFVSRLDKNGNIKFTSILGGNGTDEAIDLKITEDGGMIALLQTTSGITDNKIKDNQNQSNRNSANSKTGENLIENFTSVTAKSEDGFGGTDYWVVRLNKNGKQVWQKTFGGKGNDFPKKILTTETGFVVIGESDSPSSGNKQGNIEDGNDIWIVFLDENGNDTHQKSYNFGGRDVVMSLDRIKERKENNTEATKGYLIGGYTQAVEKIKSDDEKFWMLYIDQNRKEIWRKYIAGKEKKKEERLVSAKLQNDGSYLLTGTSADQLGEENWKILKLGDKDLDNLIEKQELRIYPNPVENYCYVEIGYDLENGEEAEISLHDMSGRQTMNLKTRNQITRINTTALPQGVYVVNAKTQKKTVTTKILKK